MHVNVTVLRFSLPLKPYELPCFRGAIIKALNEKLLLFHNHLEDGGFRYAYPLIQYKILGGKAAMVCLGEGVEQIGELFASEPSRLLIGSREVEFQAERISSRRITMQVFDTVFEYKIRRWQPLNSRNYSQFRQLQSLTEQIEMLEHILTGNILAMAKGLGIRFEERVECKITKLSDSYLTPYKDTRVECRDVAFKTNVSLPFYVGLGKHASMNGGVVYPIRSRKEPEEQSSQNITISE